MTATTSATLASLLTELLERSEHLQDALIEEQRCIAGRDLAALGAAVQRKMALLDDVQTLDAQRRAMVLAQGLPDTNSGMNELLSRSSDDGVQELWATLLHSLQQGQAMNEACGAIIRRSLEDNHRLLEVLRGEPMDSGQAAYGPGGTQQPRSGRDLGSA